MTARKTSSNGIRSMLQNWQGKLIVVLSGFAYSVFYMLFTGMITIGALPIPEDIPVPQYSIVANGINPTFVAYLNRYTTISISLEAFFVLFLISLLVGLNVAMILYKVRLSKKANCSCRTRNSLLATIAGIAPGIFSAFACCGAGIITTIFGLGIVAALLPYNYIFATMSIVILLGALLYARRSIPLQAIAKGEIA